MECKNCSYVWKTKTKLHYISCPNCGSKNKLSHYNITKETKIKLEKKANKKCEECGSEKNLEIHHIIPRQYGNLNDISNLQLLCHGCHNKKPISNRMDKNRKQIILNLTFDDKDFQKLSNTKEESKINKECTSWETYFLLLAGLK